MKKKPKPTTKLSEVVRWCFASDDDGHNYLIPDSMKARFDALLSQGERDEYEAFNAEIGQYRINSPEFYTFTDPVENP